MASFTWSITGESAMRQIKSAKADHCFRSQTFTAFGLQWNLHLYPNGFYHNMLRGQTYLFLITTLPPNVKSLEIRRKFYFRANKKQKPAEEQQKVRTAFKKKIEGLLESFRKTQIEEKELDVSNEAVNTLTHKTHKKIGTSTWPAGSVALKDLQKLDRLTFRVEFDLISALDQNDNDILGQFKDNRAERIKGSIHGIGVYPAAVTWRITDETLLKRIKSARMNSCFSSPIFEAFGHKWYLLFYPNGDREDRRGSTLMYLYVASLCSTIKAMRVCRKLTFIEGDYSHVHSDTLTRQVLGVRSWATGAVKTSDLAKYNRLTFCVEFDLCGVFDEKDNDVLSQFQDDDEKQLNMSVANLRQHKGHKASYMWKIHQSLLNRIKSAKPNQSFQSPTFTAFAHEWHLTIRTEKKDRLAVFFYAAALSSEIKSMIVRCTLRFLERNIKFNCERVLNKHNTGDDHSWPMGLLKPSDILDLDQLTFAVDFDVIEAVDRDGKQITAKWFALEEQSQRKALEEKLIAARKETESMRMQLEMEQKSNVEVNRDIPESFLCPITHRVIQDPVIAFDGRSYERGAIEEYLKKHNKSPVTGAEAITTMVFPNHDLRSRIIAFIEAQDSTSEENPSKEGEGETTYE